MAALKMWRCAQGFVVRRGVVGATPSMESASEPSDFWLIDSRGENVKSLVCTTWSIDDE